MQKDGEASGARFQVRLWSASPRLGNVAANVERVAESLQAAGAEDRLSVWPEMFLTGYNIGDDVQRLAFHPGDTRLEPLQQAVDATGCSLIVGAPFTPRQGLTYNAALCMAAGAAPVWIPKRALPTFTTFREGLFFRRGDAQPVWHAPLLGPDRPTVAVGVGICYDLYFPELQKRQALDGADVLVNISASPSTSRRFFEALVPARAIENAVFSLYSNNVGSQDGLVFWGGARGHGPRGDLLGDVEPYEEGSVAVVLDLDDLRTAREFRPTIRDTDEEDMLAVENGR